MTETAPRTRVHAALPQFLVRDVAASVAWCERVLEMRTAFTVGAPPVFALVAFSAPGQGLQLARADAALARGNRAPGGSAVDAYVRTTAADVDRRVALVRARGERLVEEPTDRPWGQREIAVADPDGHVVVLGGDLTGAWPDGRQQVSPHLLTAHLPRALAFFGDVLGFRTLAAWGQPPTFAIVERDGALVHLAVPSGADVTRGNRAAGGWDVYFECGGIDVIDADLRARGARVVRPLALTAYDMRELEVESPDGHRLAFAEPPGGWRDHPRVAVR